MLGENSVSSKGRSHRTSTTRQGSGFNAAAAIGRPSGSSASPTTTSQNFDSTILSDPSLGPSGALSPFMASAEPSGVPFSWGAAASEAPSPFMASAEPSEAPSLWGASAEPSGVPSSWGGAAAPSRAPSSWGGAAAPSRAPSSWGAVAAPSEALSPFIASAEPSEAPFSWGGAKAQSDLSECMSSALKSPEKLYNEARSELASRKPASSSAPPPSQPSLAELLDIEAPPEAMEEEEAHQPPYHDMEGPAVGIFEAIHADQHQSPPSDTAEPELARIARSLLSSQKKDVKGATDDLLDAVFRPKQYAEDPFPKLSPEAASRHPELAEETASFLGSFFRPTKFAQDIARRSTSNASPPASNPLKKPSPEAAARKRENARSRASNLTIDPETATFKTTAQLNREKRKRTQAGTNTYTGETFTKRDVDNARRKLKRLGFDPNDAHQYLTEKRPKITLDTIGEAPDLPNVNGGEDLSAHIESDFWASMAGDIPY